ncbi:MAG TPA: MarR family winged helix-turn-helix transcriptional regulator [Usitatibacter sp.]|nr:MarR family winged helix-turn-helix transcriptional regulator [Usitatibacter sp.]
MVRKGGTTRHHAAATLAEYRLRGFDCLCGNTRMAARALTALYDAHLAACGLTASQLAVLWCVIGGEPLAMRDIARHLVMDKTTVSRNVAALVDAGLVAVRAGEDARVRNLVSTAPGRRAFRAAIPLWEAAQAEVTSRMGRTKFEDAVLQTRRLARALGVAAAD